MTFVARLLTLVSSFDAQWEPWLQREHYRKIRGRSQPVPLASSFVLLQHQHRVPCCQPTLRTLVSSVFLSHVLRCLLSLWPCCCLMSVQGWPLLQIHCQLYHPLPDACPSSASMPRRQTDRT